MEKHNFLHMMAIIDLLRINNLTVKADRQAEIAGMSTMQVAVMSYLYIKNGGNVYQKDLERLFSIRHSVAVSLLKKMEASDMIVKQPVSHDARLKKITLTEHGLHCCTLLMKLRQEQEECLFSLLTQEERETLYRVLRKILHIWGKEELPELTETLL